MTTEWQWKGRDGSKGGLLYEPGNWGDLLKMLWVLAILRWKKTYGAGLVDYFDPFAGDVQYPLTTKTLYRITRQKFAALDVIEKTFLDNGLWPSAASGARLAADGRIDVWDADESRRDNWLSVSGVHVLDGADGWELLRAARPGPNAVWLLDPYDFLAGWRECLPLVAEKSREVNILLYLYNRSAKSDAAFREYRACRNALEDCRGRLPKRIGRAAADVFLPRSHHELWFLPGEADANSPHFGSLLATLADEAASLEDAIRLCGVCDA